MAGSYAALRDGAGVESSPARRRYPGPLGGSTRVWGARVPISESVPSGHGRALLHFLLFEGSSAATPGRLRKHGDAGGVLNEIAERINRAISEGPVVAASLDEVLRALDTDGAPELGAAEVVEAVLRYPDHYRLLNPMRGAWTASDLCRAPGRYGLPLREQYITPGPWIVVLDGPGNRRDGGPDPLEYWTRRALACLGRTLDDKSPWAVTRWFRLLREHRRLRARRRALGLRFSYGVEPAAVNLKVPAHQPSSASSA